MSENGRIYVNGANRKVITMTIDMSLILSLWSKTNRGVDATVADSWAYPLVLHMIDVAIAADIILDQWGMLFGDRVAHDVLRPLFLFLVGAHDIGKAIPQFQRQHEHSYQILKEYFDFSNYAISMPYGNAAYLPHGNASFVILKEYLTSSFYIDKKLSSWLARAVSGHHGFFPTSAETNHLGAHSVLMGSRLIWQQSRTQLLDLLASTLNIPTVYEHIPALSHAHMVMLAGLTTIADWIASGDVDVRYRIDGTEALSQYVVHARQRLTQRCQALQWERSTPREIATLSEIIQQSIPRPLHTSTYHLVTQHDVRFVLIEAPTGEGKTEASFVVAMAHAKRKGVLSTFFALPTQATSNQMYDRVVTWLTQILPTQSPIHLVHGGNLFVDAYKPFQQSLEIYDAAKANPHNNIQAESWFTTTKRIMLAAQGVGTVDQALMGVLKTKHGFVRLAGLAGKIVIIDEVHAYDVYTSTILDNLLMWLEALDCTVVLLSATLPMTRRQKLLSIWGVKETNVQRYPRLIGIEANGVAHIQTVPSQQSGRVVAIQIINPRESAIAKIAIESIAHGGIALVICNTVARAQQIYRDMSAYGLDCVVVLLHSRMTNVQRKEIEKTVTDSLGKNTLNRPYRMIVIGTQVLEQSLDIDADVLISDLAPIDLLIQRMGRIHRHQRTNRATNHPNPVMYVACDEPDFTQKAWFGSQGMVYESSVLLRTYIWVVQRNGGFMRIPEDVEDAVDAIYERRLELPEYRDYLLHADAELDALIQKKTWGSAMQLLGSPKQLDELFASGGVMASDDENATHHLRPRTRDGLPSLTVLCVQSKDAVLYCGEQYRVDLHKVPTEETIKRYLMPQMLKVSAQSLIYPIKKHCELPASWQRMSGIRDTYVLVVYDDNTTNVPNLCYTDTLGLYTNVNDTNEGAE